MIDQLEAAKGEKFFKRSVEKAKDAIPDGVFIDGNNPLTLLNDALSEGLHAGPIWPYIWFASEPCLCSFGRARGSNPQSARNVTQRKDLRTSPS